MDIVLEIDSVINNAAVLTKIEIVATLKSARAEILRLRQQAGDGRQLYRCDGCGREAFDPVADLNAIKADGKISCCPERKMQPVQAGDGEAVACWIRKSDLATLAEEGTAVVSYVENRPLDAPLYASPPSPAVPGNTAKALADRIALLGMASCTCLTKTPDLTFHDAACRYREIMEIADSVEALSASPASTKEN